MALRFVFVILNNKEEHKRLRSVFEVEPCDLNTTENTNLPFSVLLVQACLLICIKAIVLAFWVTKFM
jgi:hypothetical protein